MSGPTRWRDDESSSEEVRDLLRRAKGAGRSRPLPAASRARSAARLDRMLAIPAAAGVIVWLKGVALAAGIGAVAMVTGREVLGHWPAVSPEQPVPTSVTPVATPSARAIPAPTAAPAAAPLPTATSGSVATTNTGEKALAPPPVDHVSRPESDPLAREASMLDRARALLGSNPGAALAILDAHAAAFPAGHLSLERELLAVEALGHLQRISEARARGEALLERARGSIYEDRVRAILEGLPR